MSSFEAALQAALDKAQTSLNDVRAKNRSEVRPEQGGDGLERHCCHLRYFVLVLRCWVMFSGRVRRGAGTLCTCAHTAVRTPRR